MTDARIEECVHFSSTRKLARVEFSRKSYLLTIGFEKSHQIFYNQDLNLDPAFLTVALCELQPRPSASPDEIREIVEWSDKNADSKYSGHDFVGIARLYPQINVYELAIDAADATWNSFFRACIDECKLGSSWIEGRLADALHSLCELDQSRIPYKVLCRSIFDDDKSSFFLALYRCLEALYSYSSADRLAKALNITTPWEDVAAALEDSLGWHPREESSLMSIVRYASSQDLRTIISRLGVKNPAEDGDLLADQAAKAIYKLRNSIVHYRPAQQRVDMND